MTNWRTLKLPEETYLAAQKQAEADRRSVAQWVRMAIENKLDEIEAGWVSPIGSRAPKRDYGYVEDGFGMRVNRCGPDCDVEVVRPGKTQCRCEER